MQKIFITLLIVSAICTTALAQTKGNTEFGVNVGLNGATVTTNQYTNTSYRTGFNAGVSGEYYFSGRWGVKVKLSYEQKGWNDGSIGYGKDASFSTNYKLDYITVPVMANWHFGRSRNWYLNFGPYVGILLNATETATNTDLKDVFSSTDLGLDLGIGIKFPVEFGYSIFIELNGTGGGTDLIKNNTGSALRNSVSQINIGFNF
jgi:hypothetical protein